MKLLSVLFALSMVLFTDTALAAKRLGGGGSVGKQSSNVTQRADAPASTPAPAVAPAAAPTKSASAPATAGAPAAAQPQRRPWGAMLGGLAAGLGLAWLASSLGLGEGFAQLLLVGLLALLVMGVVGAWMRSRQQRQAVSADGLAYQGAASGGGMHQARDYSPKNVGNDASARPWERNTTGFQSSRFQEAPGSLIGSALPSASAWGIPQDFDVDAFLKASKTNFVNLQAAWDRADIPSLRAMMTDEMLDQIKAQLADRERQAPGAVNVTEVVMLDARLLGIEETEAEYMASVEFSGMIREDASAGPNPFREVWNITRPKAGPGGWLVAGVQALQ
ncbi:MAG TPA: Tim44-like domain-containing protein [Burkholderiaceae bacterium]|nr:Tim44-like domain-containing protein [Burkholderiaceae bacterium]